MKFIDEANIHVKAGSGGNGIISFRREARVAHGGPDGGDGGHGGSVIFRGNEGMNTLLNLKLQKNIFGFNGENGRHKNQYGAAGKNLIVDVPIGTTVKNGDKIVCDVIKPIEYIIAKGGRGGKGNTKFKNAHNTAPRLSENGEKGEALLLHLTLKVLADVGFVGMPSAGKSTLLSKISNATPKIADYEFTTLVPQLGMVKTDNNSFVAADLPGLIKGAAQGKGLGFEFLKHIERCKIIAYVIDFGSENRDPIVDYLNLTKELKDYSLELEKRGQIIIANKNDLALFAQNHKSFISKFPNLEVISISGLKEKNIVNLKRAIFQKLANAKELIFETKIDEVTIELATQIEITKINESLFEVGGSEVERIYNRIPLNSEANFMRFNKKLKDAGVWEALRTKGVHGGDTIRIFSYEFTWGEE